MHTYLFNGYPNLDQSLIPRNWSKVKLRRAFSLELGSKGVQSGWNIAKVGVHSYLPNANLNLRSNFNYEKLVKSETSSCGFSKIGVKGGENSSKRHKSWSARLSIEWA